MDDGRKPKESNVYSGLLELAVYAREENNIFHKDVIDAMFRQPFSAEAIPFHLHILKTALLLMQLTMIWEEMVLLIMIWTQRIIGSSGQ